MLLSFVVPLPSSLSPSFPKLKESSFSGARNLGPWIDIIDRETIRPEGVVEGYQQ